MGVGWENVEKNAARSDRPRGKLVGPARHFGAKTNIIMMLVVLYKVPPSPRRFSGRPRNLSGEDRGRLGTDILTGSSPETPFLDYCCPGVLTRRSSDDSGVNCFSPSNRQFGQTLLA